MPPGCQVNIGRTGDGVSGDTVADEEVFSDGGDLPEGVGDGVSLGGVNKIDRPGDGVSSIGGVSPDKKIEVPLAVGRGILAKPFEGVVFAGRVLKVGRKMVEYALLQEKNGVWEYRKIQRQSVPTLSKLLTYQQARHR